MNIKYLCGDCGQSHTQESEAINCCNQSEGSILVSECCEAEVIPMTIEEYPFDEYATCDKCLVSVE